MASSRTALRIGQLRTAKGWSLRELAKRSGVSVTNLSDLERGRVLKPHSATGAAIARALGWARFDEMIESDLLDAPPVPFIATGESVAELRERLERVERQLQQRSLLGTVAAREHDVPRPHPGDWRPAVLSVHGAETLLDVDAFSERDQPRIPPAGYENQLPEGYALRVKGDSLAGLPKPIVDGDWVWIDPIQHGEHTQWPGRPHVALVRHTPDAEPIAVVKLLKVDGLYSVTRSADGRTREVKLDVAEVLAVTPVIAVERSSDPI